jgi:nucleotide-binding universal stress UspA family protein
MESSRPPTGSAREWIVLRILLPVDGSQPSLRAVHHALKLVADKPNTELHVLNVQVPLPAAAADFLNAKDVRTFHLDEGKSALREANAILEAAHVRYESTVLVGPVAETIADYAEERHCDQIIMGTRGLSPIAGLLLGSVAMKILHLAKVPVTLAK